MSRQRQIWSSQLSALEISNRSEGLIFSILQQETWELKQLLYPIDWEGVQIDPAPFQLVERTSLHKVSFGIVAGGWCHSCFTLLIIFKENLVRNLTIRCSFKWFVNHDFMWQENFTLFNVFICQILK